MRSLSTTRNAERGVSLIVTLVIAAGASVLVGGVLFYTASQTNLTRRLSQYESSVATAAAATEKVVTRITKDFMAGGETQVGSSLATYNSMVPTPEDLTARVTSTLTTTLNTTINTVVDNSGPGSANSGSGSSSGSTVSLTPTATTDSVKRWKKFDFTDTLGQLNRTDIQCVSPWAYRDLGAKFPGLKGFAADYAVISNVREKERSFKIVSGVRQDVQIAAVPLCQFQFFYVPDMELNPPGAGMTLNGRVHCNSSMYLSPNVELTFQNHVTASRRINHNKHPADPVSRVPAKVSYRAERESGLNTLNLSIGTNAGPLQLREILQPPASLESPTSQIAQERFYNKADLIIVVSNDVVTGRSGPYNGGSVSVPWLASRGIVTRTTQDFYDQRECKDLKVTEVDLAKFALNYDELTRLLGRPAKTLWITDMGDDGKRDTNNGNNGNGNGNGNGNDKPKDKDGNLLDNDNGKGNDDKGATGILGGILQSTTVPPGVVRLKNGATLPTAGLTIATPNPLYVQGHYNTTAVPAPACLAGDAVTVLSGNWTDLNSTRTVASRVATDTTVNAAIITGIVPTGSGAYSGGVENSLRLLEDWTGRTLTFKGSILVLYYSKVADAPWGGPNVYVPPTRAWSYNTKLTDAAGIPPSMPAARTVYRSDWRPIKAQSKS